MHVCDACLLKSIDGKPNACSVCKAPYANVVTSLDLRKLACHPNLLLLASFSLSMSGFFGVSVLFVISEHPFTSGLGMTFFVYGLLMTVGAFHLRKRLLCFDGIHRHSLAPA